MTLSSLVSNLFSGPDTRSLLSTHAPSDIIAQPGGLRHDQSLLSSPSSPVFHTQPASYNNGPSNAATSRSMEDEEEEEEEEPRPPYLHAMIAGGIGGMMGDVFMHSLDTVKTRQQGDPNIPPKYGSMAETYRKIFRQEGLRRGLYAGVTPAMLGSFPGTVIFFGTYEYTKRQLIDRGILPAAVAYAAAGLVGDFAASFIYVPSEVLKTRLQLQGRYNNPHFYSGYNYKGTADAARTIARTEGISALFYGYKATIMRDLPFSALQFAFYEQERQLAKRWVGNRDIGLGLEIITGMTAGGLAGIITCPLDVVKTRIQTQVNPETARASPCLHPKGPQPVAAASGASQSSPPRQEQLAAHKPSMSSSSSQSHHKQQRPDARAASSAQPTASASASSASPASVVAKQQLRNIATGSPSTSTPRPGSMILDTSSVGTGLRLIYRHEGVAGLFRGVGPRAVWTSVQSGCMFVVYQQLLTLLERHPLVNEDGDGIAGGWV